MDVFINQLIPLHALVGGTPFEVWSGKWGETAKAELDSAQVIVKGNRIVSNKTVLCGLLSV